MIKPHGGTLVNRVMSSDQEDKYSKEFSGMPQLTIDGDMIEELQNIAKFLKVGLKPKRLDRYLKEIQIDETHPFLNHYPNRCVLCGKCVHICRGKHDQSVLTFAKRGFDTVISTYSVTDVSSLTCRDCDTCVKACPVGALAVKEPSQ